MSRKFPGYSGPGMSDAEIESYRYWFSHVRNPKRYNYPPVPLHTLRQWSDEWLSFHEAHERENRKETEDYNKWLHVKHKRPLKREVQNGTLKLRKRHQQCSNQKVNRTGSSFDPVRKSKSSAQRSHVQHSRKGNRHGKPISR